MDVAYPFSFYSLSTAEIKLVLHVVLILFLFVTYLCHMCYLVSFTQFEYLGSDRHIDNCFEVMIASKYTTRSALLELMKKNDSI